MPPSYISFDSDSDGADLELGVQRRSRRRKPFTFNRWARQMLQSLRRRLQVQYKLRPVFIAVSLFILGFTLTLLFYEQMDSISRGYSEGYRSQVSGNSHLYAHLRNLVMVAGHSVYTSSGCGKAEGEDSWFLESYQKHPGQAATFVDHIKVGVEVASKDDKSLLLFSGGETRKEAGPRSEAQSYWGVAESKHWFGSELVRERALTEEHARDSFENLLFSICRFRELTGAYPSNITVCTIALEYGPNSAPVLFTCISSEVVSYDFKQFRFANLHRSALHFPASRFSYIGTPSAADSIVAAQKGELHVQDSFQRDPYGCEGLLQEKRLKRDPFSRTIPYPIGCPEIRNLFTYCGSELYSKRLPWDD